MMVDVLHDPASVFERVIRRAAAARRFNVPLPRAPRCARLCFEQPEQIAFDLDRAVEIALSKLRSDTRAA
jgi:hypothetical protein